MAFRLLASAVTGRIAQLNAGVQFEMAALVRCSIGDPTHYRTSVDKTLLPAFAGSMGLRVPAHRVVAGVADADSFVARHGYPVVLKRAHGFAGQGVAICTERESLVRAFAAFAAAEAADIGDGGPPRYLLQAYVSGSVQYFHAAAWQGQLLAGFALEKLIAHPAPCGPPTMTRYFAGDALRKTAASLARSLGISGLFFAEFIVEDETGVHPLLEINRRVSPATHRGAARDVDLCAALYGAITGEPSTSRCALEAGEEGITVHFPQEWLRDPQSPHLGEHPSDIPWDEPALFRALLRGH